MIITIIVGIISLICFIILSLLSNKNLIWWLSFIVALLLNCYTIYENIILEKRIIKFENRIETSNIQVNIEITVDEDTQGNLDGRIATNVYICELITKSGKKIVYKSESGSAKIIRGGKKYLFEYRANLSPENNIFRNFPNELKDAKQITIPLSPFIKLIRKDIRNTVKCMLTRAEIKYFINNNLIYFKKEEQNIVIDSNDNNTIFIYFTK